MFCSECGKLVSSRSVFWTEEGEHSICGVCFDNARVAE